ncbi:TRAP transporter substrate-binding protein DctP [Pseudonocardia thermophila]|jgi:TRAP-type C4-dicarboxylate transport system, periplasmic component|uniref:TRAP transporter substrate-binding protein DctP n=1 Tax=Pseudonocardia thermophila TaxID=1848 RepID=UPI00248D5215|nr:TRAP transporter substrate-binding protein DctP [Pseudonocardia thermophila]
MRRTTRAAIAVCTALGAALAGGCAGSTPGGAATSTETMEPITITVSDLANEHHSTAVGLRTWADEVTARTGGKVRFEYFWSGSLAPGNEALDALGGGLAQLGGVIPDYFDQELPTAQWFTGLLGVLSPASPHGFLQGSLAADEFFKQPAVEAEFAEHNLKVVSAAVTEPYSLLCTKPSETLAQTTGLRARTAGATRNAELAALGLTAVNLPPDDVYDGMQRGVIDCTVAAKSLMSTYGLWEVAPYFTPVGITPALRVNAMNLDVWNALPPDVQKVMMDAVPTYIAGIVRAELDAYAKLFGPDGPAAKVHLQNPAELGEHVRRAQAERLTGLAAHAPATIADPADEVRRFRESAAAWLAVVLDDMGVPEPRLDTPEAIRASFVEGAAFDLDRWVELVRAKRGGS